MLKQISMALTLVIVPSLLQAQSITTSGNASLDVSIRSAVDAGTPASVVANKVAEGRAKGASDAQIAAALSHQSNLLLGGESWSSAENRSEATSTLNGAAAAGSSVAGSVTALLAGGSNAAGALSSSASVAANAAAALSAANAAASIAAQTSAVLGAGIH
jgi:hypothetical protein